MVERIPFLIEGIRLQILSVESTISELAKIDVKTEAEVILRREVGENLETASDSLIDAYQLLTDAMACSNDGDLISIMEQADEGKP